MIHLGYACVNLTLGRKTKSLRLATLRKLGLPYLQQLVDENLEMLAAILAWNREEQIWMFRISSDLVPLGSHAEVDLAQLTFDRARAIGALATGMRLSMHPGQYTLPSADGLVWERSYQDLVYHAFLLDQLGLTASDLILHGGGVYGDRPLSTGRIIANISSLPPAVKRRLRLENDERSWSVADLLPICEATDTPLVVDVLHHQLNGSVPFAALPWERIFATWHGLRPKLHYAEQDPQKRSGAHSEYITAQAFSDFASAVPLQDYDVMLECKAKDLALLRLRSELAALSTTLAATIA